MSEEDSPEGGPQGGSRRGWGARRVTGERTEPGNEFATEPDTEFGNEPGTALGFTANNDSDDNTAGRRATGSQGSTGSRDGRRSRPAASQDAGPPLQFSPNETGEIGEAGEDEAPGRSTGGRRGRAREAGSGEGTRGRRSRRQPGQMTEEEARDPLAAARNICLRLLTDRPRTRAELATALAKRGIPAEAADAVLDRYDEVGLIDDAAFARAWVSSRHHGRGLARRALGQELRRKGVDTDTIGEALGELDSDTEEETARALVERKLRSTRGEPEAVLRKLVGMLARKGYAPGLSFRVVKEALERAGEEAEFDPEALSDGYLGEV